MIGDRLGKWVIFKELGRGGMGRVYLAQEEIGGRQAALKILAAELAQDVGFLHRFQREIETLSQLDHPGIVRFYESGFENGQYFYAMEYVEGQNLEDILMEQRRLPWQEVLDIALQLCPALKHAHDHGVIHRDIKLPNVLRTPDGKIKLTDFGIAKVFATNHLTATGGIVGTAEFLSPEQAAGKPVSKRSDLYSLGVLLYTLLTGRTPFEGNTFLELLHKHRYAQFDPPHQIVEDVPYEIDEIVCQLLAKDPAERPADCLVLAKQLDAVRRKLERKGLFTEAGAQREATIAENKPAPELFEGKPGPATLMSRLMREELERAKYGGPVTRLFNRAWVLVPLLLLSVGLIVWRFMADSDEAPPPPPREEAPAMSAAQGFYQRGERLRLEGDAAAARKVWGNLVAVFQGVESEKEWVHRAEQGLEQLDDPATAKARWVSVRKALANAAALRAEGKAAAAERIWAGLEALYTPDEPGAREILRQVREARNKK